MQSKKRSTPKKKPARKKPVFNLNNPELADKVELAFECAGVKFYRFVDEYQMPTGRYKWVMNYLREVDLRVDLDTMKAYMKELTACLNGSRKQIDLSNAFKVIHSIQTRLELAFEPETVERLASVVYFDDAEDLSDFNMQKGEQKRNLWKRNKNLSFFLTKPISELLRLKDISPESLQVYIEETREIIKELISPLQSSQQENISENGMSTS